MDLSQMTLTELRAALISGETSSVAATQAMLDRIAAIDPTIKSYLRVTANDALRQAEAADARLAAGLLSIDSIQGVEEQRDHRLFGMTPRFCRIDGDRLAQQ